MLVALHKGEGFIARAIRWQTRSGYSHASVLLEEAELVVEAREFQGVRIVPWVEVVASGEVVDLFAVKGLTREQEIGVREFLWDQLGKPYDYMMVARFVSRRQEERASSGKWFCSELVFAAFAQAGVMLLERIEPWAVSPGMLSLSTRLEEVGVKPRKTQNTRTGELKGGGNVQRPTLNFQRSEGVDNVARRAEGAGVVDAPCYDSPLTPALSPLRGEGEETLGVSKLPGLARANVQAGKGSTESRPTGMEGAGEGACTTMADGGVCPTKGTTRQVASGGKRRQASALQSGEQAGRLRYGPRDAGATGKEVGYAG